MISRWCSWLAIGLALLLSAPLHAAWQSAVSGNMLGKRMPPLAPAAFGAQQGEPGGIGIGTGPGNGVLLVDFWEPSCVPCRERVPLLNRLQAEYRAHGLAVIGIARAPPAQLAQFARHVTLDYPVGCDPGGAVFKQMGMHSLPYAVLVDRNGIIVWQGDPAGLRRATIETTLAAPRLGALLRL